MDFSWSIDSAVSFQATVGEVTLGMRDGAAQVLRCLKVCFSAGSRPFCLAIRLMDQFLTCLKVRAFVMFFLGAGLGFSACRWFISWRTCMFSVDGCVIG